MIVQLPTEQLLFPSPTAALRDPNGLLAVGGDLSPARLLCAYQQGIFPWFGEHDPILWWSPDPRAVFKLDALHVSRSMRKFIRQTQYSVSLNLAFTQVIEQCAAQRRHREGTWITPAMQHAYTQLHQLGHAHSIEVWDGAKLVGGMYGVAVGRIFCGESMFQQQTNASKLALFTFAQAFAAAGGRLIDAQVGNPHLASLGAQAMPREKFLHQLHLAQQQPLERDFWRARTLPLCSLV